MATRWTRLPAAPTSVAAEPGVVVWTGTELVVWGLVSGEGTRVGTGGFEFAPR